MTNILQKYMETLRKHPLPIWAGLGMIGVLQANRLLKEAKEKHEFEGIVVSGYKALPLRSVSRLWGRLNEVEIPSWSRSVIIGCYAKLFKCKLEEAEDPEIKNYKSLGQFFRRRLKPGVRPIDPDSNSIVSPCDGKVLYFGRIDTEDKMESVKGVQYSVRDFLGFSPLLEDSKNSLYYCTFYLAPGDYHGFHSPTSWSIRTRDHFEGHLLSVSPKIVKKIPKLFHINERVIYSGHWDQGFFSYGAIGATNVGTIRVEKDSKLATNRIDFVKDQNCFPIRQEFDNFKCEKGDYFGEFNLGSSIVIIFEANSEVRFQIKPGEQVQMGQSIVKVLNDA